MNTLSVVMTVIGPDRPGLVESLSALVSDHDANWLESRMARLAGQFAGILRIEVPVERRAALLQALAALEDRGLHITLLEGAAAPESQLSQVVRLELVGNDRPGIVRQISRVIAHHGVNVDELETETESAAMSAEPLFKASALLKVPAGVSLETLRSDLEQVSHDLMVDITLEAG